MDTSTRLNKYISESGICSRREADKFIESRVVFVNGKCAKTGDKVFPGDVVRVNGRVIEPKPEEEAVYLLFNKPRGIVSTTDPSEKDNIIDYISYGERIFPVGRLDKDSQGLIILTSNGGIVNKILRAGNKHEKEYVVTVDKPVTEQFVKSMSSGVPILGVNTKKCKVEMVSKFVFRITLVQGLNRQIRRMCEYLGYEVTKLERVRIMHLTLKGIGVGQYREFKQPELDELNNVLKHSNAEPTAKKSTSTSKKPANKPSSRNTDGKSAPKTNAHTNKDRKTAYGKPKGRSGNQGRNVSKGTSNPSGGRGGRNRGGR